MIYDWVISSRNINSVETWASEDSPLAQLVKELDLCYFLCVIQSPWDGLPPESINNFSLSSRLGKDLVFQITKP